MKRKSILVFLLFSLLLAGFDAVFILINYYSSKSALDSRLAMIGKEVEAAFLQAQHATEQRMVQLATCIAADTEIQHLFLAAKEAVAAQSDDTGGIRAAAIRQALYQRAAIYRDSLAGNSDLRQLHFLLAPGSLSFLRVHAPESFGDRVDAVRHTAVMVNRTRQPVAGFESGRIFSGIRGVVPVFVDDPQREKDIYIGALEAGTSYQNTLENAARTRHVGMAVLLAVEHLEANVRPEQLQSFLQMNPPISGLVPEATTGAAITTLLRKGLLPAGSDLAMKVVNLETVPHLIVRFPLYDFEGLQNHTLPPAGSIIAWQNVSKDMQQFSRSLKNNIFFGLFAYILIEVLLYCSFHLGTKRLQSLLARGRRDLADSLEQLQSSEEKFQTMAEFSIDWDAWRGPDGQYLYITPSCEEISGYPREVFYRDPAFFSSIIHVDDKEGFLRHHQQLNREHSGPAEMIFRIHRKDGDIRWIWHKCQPVFSEDGVWRGRRTTNRDITVLKETEEKLRHLSTTDPLTGAFNRRMFMDLLSREMKRVGRYGESFCLLMFDLDHFKTVNDNYGHDVGDQVLIEVVQLSMETIRHSDVLARWGGEEFMVLLPQANLDMALSLGQRLRQRISKHTFTGAGHVTVSIGVTHMEEGYTVDELLKRVDDALYEAKESGRNRVVGG